MYISPVASLFLTKGLNDTVPCLRKCVLQKPAIINAHVWSFNFSEQIIFHVYFDGWASENNYVEVKNFPIYGTNVHLYTQSHIKTSLTEMRSMETTTHNDKTYYAKSGHVAKAYGSWFVCIMGSR